MVVLRWKTNIMFPYIRNTAIVLPKLKYSLTSVLGVSLAFLLFQATLLEFETLRIYRL